MTTTASLAVGPKRLAEAWNEMLPQVIDPSDKASAAPDGKDPNTLRIRIENAGRSGWQFEFSCTYVDSREVKVELVSAEQDGEESDERSETAQKLIEKYVRRIHECAQRLKGLTKG